MPYHLAKSPDKICMIYYMSVSVKYTGYFHKDSTT